jgi:hypothetical protein
MKSPSKKYLSVGITVKDIYAAVLLLNTHGFEAVEMNETNDGLVFALMKLSKNSDFEIYLFQPETKVKEEEPSIELVTVQGKYHASWGLLKDVKEWKAYRVHKEADIF